MRNSIKYRTGTIYANGYFSKANGTTMELQRNINLRRRNPATHLMAYRNTFRNVINNHIQLGDSLNPINGKQYGSIKYCFGTKDEQQWTDNIVFFFQGSWTYSRTAT